MPIPISACNIFLCPNSGRYGCQCLGFWTLSLSQPVKFPGWKAHVYTPAKSIFDNSITNLLLILRVFLEIFSRAHAKGEKRLNDFKFVTFIGRFLRVGGGGRGGMDGSEGSYGEGVNVRTDVDACDCTRGCMDTVSESALEADSGRKIPCRTWDSNPQQYCAWIFSQTLYQLSYPGPGDNTVSIFQLHLRQFTFKKRTIFSLL